MSFELRFRIDWRVAAVIRRCGVGVVCMTLVLAVGRVSVALQGDEGPIVAVWANTGEDKVTRDELRLSRDRVSVQNSIWDGSGVSLFAARNETVAFNLVMETSGNAAHEVEVELTRLQGPDGVVIGSRPAVGAAVFDYVGRNIELFFVRYVEIKGVSVLSYEHYDERHVPHRLRRPHNANGRGRGTWEDRPDHNQRYPDIAVPLEWHAPFSIPSMSSQSIWVDIYVPRSAVAGMYQGTLRVRERQQTAYEIPIELDVRDFELFDLPAAKTMVYYSAENINRRYLGEPYPNRGTPAWQRSRAIIDRHFQLAHRHRLSLIGDHTPIQTMQDAWLPRLDGSLFTRVHRYAGVGEGIGNNVFSIGTYGLWPWRDKGKAAMWTHTDQWVAWFDQQAFRTPTDYFLYLIDESDDYPLIQKWADWADENSGVGQRMLTMATIPAPQAVQRAPSLDVVASTVMAAPRAAWQQAIEQCRRRGRQHLMLYNGWRPSSGTFTTEDDGVALRELAWGQFKMSVRRWFAWESTYYRNFQGGRGDTNVFQSAHTFGGLSRRDSSLGETGFNYNNGDGVLFYPGTDRVFPQDNYEQPGPIASLRMKHWRRGLQDVDYLVLAARQDIAAVRRIVKRMIPRVLWELDVTDQSDPTWVQSDISWPTDPDVWEAARRELADLIDGKTS